MRRLILAVLLNATALWVADQYIAGFTVQSGIGTLLAAGLVLGVLNAFAKPVLKIVAFPLMLVTLGLFSLVINALLLWAVTVIVPSVVFSGLMALVWATLVVTIANIFLNWLS